MKLVVSALVVVIMASSCDRPIPTDLSWHTGPTGFDDRGGPIADSHGIWFGSSAGIYLYSPGVGMRKVSDQAGY
ncbi:MAG TPA: hypothetical protein VF383_14170, partial [Candidatus Dormibacteraeota bacterium]